MITKAILLISDIAAFCVVLILAFFIREMLGGYDKTLLQTVYMLWWGAVVISFSFLYEGLYSKKRPFWLEVRFIIKALLVAFTVMFAILSLSKTSDNVSRLIIILMFVLSVFIFPIFRKYFKTKAQYKEKVIIIGADTLGINCAKALLEDKYLGYDIIGFLDDSQKTPVNLGNTSLKVYGKINKISRFAPIGIKTAIIALGAGDKTYETAKIAHKCMKNVLIVPDAKGLPLANTESTFLFEQDIFLLKIKNNLESTYSKIAKRTFDIVLAILIMPILAPIMLIIAVMIGDKAVFAQNRMGVNAKPFVCYKFRTMHHNSAKILNDFLDSNQAAKEQWERYKKLKDTDPRVTKIGVFLRKTSLDELPQIFNIIKGEMSFVGPRPYLYSEKADMGGEEDIILMCKPGITGLWQVSGRNELDFKERVKLDVYYVTNWSLWLDIVILFKTVKVVLWRKGAY